VNRNHVHRASDKDTASMKLHHKKIEKGNG
jgi:hypothetical protein